MTQSLGIETQTYRGLPATVRVEALHVQELPTVTNRFTTQIETESPEDRARRAIRRALDHHAGAYDALAAE